MSPSESQRRASAKYNLEHMITLGCKVKRVQADKFKAYAQKQGKTANTILKEHVLKCIKDDTQP